jgi:hypothetical protein
MTGKRSQTLQRSGFLYRYREFSTRGVHCVSFELTEAGSFCHANHEIRYR